DQWRRPISTGSVWIGVLLQQRPDRRDIAVLHCVNKLGIVGRSRSKDADEQDQPDRFHSSSLPVLSPYLSIAIPAMFMTDSHRFAAGVEPSLTLMCLLPLSAPAAPPTSTIGRLVWIC